jgi:hypothetical protein
VDPDLERTLQGLQDAAAFLKSYHFELTGEYLASIEAVEALPCNQSGADKSGRWRGSRPYARAVVARAAPAEPDR